MGHVVSIEPLAPPATSMLVLLHGLGDNADQFQAVGRALQPSLPHTIIIVPDAIEAFDLDNTGDSRGRQWFSFRGLTPERRIDGVAKAASVLSPWLDEQLKQRGLGPDALMVLGFSQGAMLANRLALERSPAPRRTVGIGGLLAAPPTLRPSGSPKVLLIHGDVDERIPLADDQAAAMALKERGVDVELQVIAGLGHRITPDVIARAAAFFGAE